MENKIIDKSIPKMEEFLFECNKYFRNQLPVHIREGRELKEEFKDEFFKPNINSLLSKNEDGSFIDEINGEAKAKEIKADNIEWKRISEVFKEFTVFQDVIEI